MFVQEYVLCAIESDHLYYRNKNNFIIRTLRMDLLEAYDSDKHQRKVVVRLC